MRWASMYHPERADTDICDFEVVGEFRADPNHLLLRGCDGHFYAMDADSGELHLLEPDDSWAMDVTKNTSLHLELPRDVVCPH